MKRHLVLGLLLLVPDMAVRADIDIANLRGEAYTDIGHLVSGFSPRSNQEIEGQFLTRLGVTITATDTILDKLRLAVGVGGLFWQPFPTYATTFWKSNIQFGPGITEASAKFQFNPSWALEGGYFPAKYNGSAMNLGEYLLRSDAYPGYLATGTWTWVDSAYVRAFGIRAQGDHFGGAFHHELGFFWEFQNPPLFDLTPAYLFSWRPVRGLEIGGGAALRRWFSNNLSFSADKTLLPARQYVEIANFPEVQHRGMIHYTYDGGVDSLVASWRPGTAPDIGALSGGKPNAAVQGIDTIQQGSLPGARTGIKKFLMNMKHCDEAGTDCKAYLDAKGNLVGVDGSGALVPDATTAAQFTKQQEIFRRAITLMGRLELDFAEMLGTENFTGPFKAYTEAAVLGLENQPVYYEKISDRIPVMVGLHIPTFGLMDLLAVEAEYFSNPYRDSEDALGGGQYGFIPGGNLPIPDLDLGEYDKPRFKVPSIHGDDVKWSVHAVRTLTAGVKLKAQIANDHLRLHNYEALPSPSPQTVARDHWYYVVHLQWGF